MSDDILESIADRYAHGDCVPFAVAVNRKFGWDVVEFKAGGIPIHAACKMPDGNIFDAYGVCKESDVLKRYKSISNSIKLTPSSSADIMAWGGLFEGEDDMNESEIEEADDHLSLLLHIIDPDEYIIGNVSFINDNSSAAIAKKNYSKIEIGLDAINLNQNGMDIVSIASIMSRESYKSADDLFGFDFTDSSSDDFYASELSMLNRHDVRFVMSNALNMPKEGTFNHLKWSFKDHLFECENASAIVSEFSSNGKSSVMIAFRGTDQLSDVKDYAKFSNHYLKFKPLIDAVKSYVEDKDSEYLICTGHSLGGAIAQEFLCDNRPDTLKKTLASKMRGITFGSPGAADYGDDSRMLHIQHPADMVTHIGGLWHAKSGFTVNLSLDPSLEKKSSHKNIKFRLPKTQNPQSLINYFSLKTQVSTSSNAVSNALRLAHKLVVVRAVKFVRSILNTIKLSAHRMNVYTDTVTVAINTDRKANSKISDPDNGVFKVNPRDLLIDDSHTFKLDVASSNVRKFNLR